MVGLLLLLSATLLIGGREARGITLGYFALLFSLAGVNLLVFYFEQFSTILKAVVQFALLMGLLHTRRRVDSRDT